MQKVAFICVHNSCRSQIAEALGRHLAGDVFESYSAGTETKPQINPDAVRLTKQVHHIDMEAEGQHSKLLSDIPAVAVAIALFGTTSPAALATTVGVLTEVPVMLFLVRIAKRTQGWFAQR